MPKVTKLEKADRFRALHLGPRILILPNAWDVASARIFEAEGFPAVATTSAGIASTLGYPDGERISRTEMLGMVERIARALDVPLSADVEAGYDDPVATARAVAKSGAIGMNLEDVEDQRSGTLRDLAHQAEIIREIQALSLPLVVNARTDIYLAQVGDPATRFARTVERLNAYRQAGADCLFAPGVTDRETIAGLAREVSGPLNVLATAGIPPAAELESLGVARVSVGSGISRAALGLVRRTARELLDDGSFTAIFEGQIPYAELNNLLAK
jgi:2-methylisocitrate lyase-like PEP mutase family enzyme